MPVWFRDENGGYEERTRKADGTFKRERTSGSRYTEIFIEAYGDLPARCDACRIGLCDVAWIIHHKDHNHWNHDVSNLVALCRRCHQREHRLGVKQSFETGKKRGESYKKFLASLSDEEYRAYFEHIRSFIPDTKGHKKHQGFGDLQSNAQYTSRMRYCECGLETNAGAMAHHVRKTGHAFTK